MTIVPTFGIVAVVPALNVPVTPAMLKLVTVTGPSTLLVPVSTVPVIGVSSGVDAVSFRSLNVSSTGVTVISKVEVSSVPEPSVKV